MYLDDLAEVIRSKVPADRRPDGDDRGLFRLYAALLLVKGVAVTESDVHDAWCVWMSQQDEAHESLVPYESLPEEIKAQDRPFVEAIRAASAEHETVGLTDPFEASLFPRGVPTTEEDRLRALELYKIMVASSESLVSRRQTVNTLFLTINGALLTAISLFVRSSGQVRLSAWGVAVLALAGALLAGAWISLIISFGQLNKGKFKVINSLEQHLAVAIYAAEWEALGRGQDPEIYRPFTNREIWVPRVFVVLYGLAVGTGILVGLGWVTLD